MKKTAAIMLVMLSLLYFPGCGERVNPFAPFLVPQPQGPCGSPESFGTKTGEMGVQPLAEGEMWVSRCALYKNAAVNAIYIYTESKDTSVIVGIYNSSFALVASSGIVRLTGNGGWMRIDISATLAPGEYGIAVKAMNPMDIFVRKDAFSQATGVFGAPGNTLPSALSDFRRESSDLLMAYADYCPL